MQMKPETDIITQSQKGLNPPNRKEIKKRNEQTKKRKQTRKRNTIIGKAVELHECLCTVGGYVNYYNDFENHLILSAKGRNNGTP